MTSPFDPIPYVQWRTDCTADDITAWDTATYESHWDPEGSEVTSLTPPTHITALPRLTGPCLGCGRPTGDVNDAALTLTTVAIPMPTATFHPCGCVLRVRTQPILDHVPDGAFPFKKAGLPLDDETAKAFARQPELRADLGCRLAPYLGKRPDVVKLLNPEETRARGLHGWVLVGYILHARPGTTKWIVVRGDAGMPPGFMPPGLDGRWQEREGIPDYPPIFEGPRSTVTAHPTGRVEIREDGAVAEVYEMLRNR